MNDPVTNVEIEDVLSSIRRLVSENARAERLPDASEPRAKTAESAEDPVQAKPEIKAQEAQILVLTPALRVEDDAGQVDEAQIDTDADDEAGDDLQALIDDIAEESAVEGVLDDLVEDEDGDATGLGGLSFVHSDDVAHAPEMSTLEDRIAGLEAAVAEREDNWEPDGIGDDENAGAPVESLNWEDSDVTVSRWEAEEAMEEAELVSDQAVEPAMDLSEFADTDIETGAQADAVYAEPAPEPEAELQTEPEAEEWTDEADPQLSQGLEPDTDLFGGEESLIDEEILRDMVAEIVRQELQGSLGERITRNVRKLVRREIHRSLAARELD